MATTGMKNNEIPISETMSVNPMVVPLTSTEKGGRPIDGNPDATWPVIPKGTFPSESHRACANKVPIITTIAFLDRATYRLRIGNFLKVPTL